VKLGSLKKGGDLYFRLSNLKLSGQQLSTARAVFWSEGVSIDQLLPTGSVAIGGKLTSDGDVFLDVTDYSKIQGDIDLNLQSFKTPGQNLQGIIVPAINWGAIKAKISIKNGIAEIKGFQIGGPGSDVQGSIAGEIRLGRDWAGCYVNLTSFKLAFSDAFVKNPNSDTILSTLNSIDKRSPGNYSMKWNKSFAEIAQNFLFALPEKN
jgi:hypothetical protein